MSSELGHFLREGARPLSEEALSQTLSVARLGLVIGLVFLHYRAFPESTYWPWDGFDPDVHPVATFVNSFMLFFFFSSTPLLSFISGWLFFSFGANTAAPNLHRRVARRFTSVYLPMVAWNVFYLLLLLGVFALRPDAPILETLNIDFASAGWWDYADAVFAVTQRPIGFQFWFVRDLFVAALISPLLWWLMRRAPFLGACLLGAAWLAGSNLFVFFRSDVVFFFYIGGLFRVRGIRLEIGPKAVLTLCAFYLLLVVFRTSAPAFVEWTGQARPIWLTLVTRVMRIVGALACWGLFVHLAATQLGAYMARFGGLAFFLHAAHFPLIEAVKLHLWPQLPELNDGWMVLHYLASVCLTIAIAMTVGVFLARAFPNAFALMNGGRLAFENTEASRAAYVGSRAPPPPAL